MQQTTGKMSLTRRAFAIALMIAAASYAVRAAGNAAAASPTVTIQSLLHEMVDRDALARLPDPAFKLGQATSYDRRTKDPRDPDGWFANGDNGQFIRTEKHGDRTEWVMMEHQGPGAIVRMWTPLWDKLDDAIVRIYLDGADKPAVAVNFQQLLRGEGFVKPPLAFIAWPNAKPGATGVAGDCYAPIPFAHACKITLDHKPFYYGINYRMYAPDAKVKSFTMDDYHAAAPVIEQVGQQLDHPTQLLDVDAHAKTITRELSIEANGRTTIDLPTGARAVRLVQLTMDRGAADQALRSVVLTMHADGRRTMWCPIGDLFGCGVRWQPVQAYDRGVSADRVMSARWVMPYENEATLSVVNCGQKTAKATLKLIVSDWQWDRRSLHFHANWRNVWPLSTRPFSDFNYINIDGRGRYVGDTLTFYTPKKAWPGEGDEKVYIDGERIPSQIGTGTEDYYGYAWGMAGHFDSPFISMPRRDMADDRGDWRGYTTVNRDRLLDDNPFDKSLSMNIELWSWADTTIEYSAATMWYARPGAESNRGAQPHDATRAIIDFHPPQPKHVAGAIEGESLHAEASAGVDVAPQDLHHWAGQFSGDSQMFIRAGKVGDTVDVTIPVGDDQPHRLTMYPTLSYDYGVWRISVGDHVLRDRFDAYADQPQPGKPVDLGVIKPTDHRIVLHLQLVGANAKAKPPKTYFGIDCFTVNKP